MVAVEMSSQLERRGTLSWLLSGLLELLERLGDQDRVTVVAVQNEVLFRTEPLTKHDGALLTAQWPKKTYLFPSGYSSRLAICIRNSGPCTGAFPSRTFGIRYGRSPRMLCRFAGPLEKFWLRFGAKWGHVSVVDVARNRPSHPCRGRHG